LWLSWLQDGDPNFKKRRLIVQDTKKFGCKAVIKLKEILKFPDFKVSVNGSCLGRFVSGAPVNYATKI
jgi:hypothetical protein